MSRDNYIKFCFWLCLLLTSCDTERTMLPNEEAIFVKLFGSFDNDQGVKVAELPSVGYLLLGTTQQSNVLPGETVNSSALLTLTDFYGETIWNREIKGIGSYTAGSIIVSDNNEIFISGSSPETDTNTNTDIFLAQISMQGEPLWVNYFGKKGISETAIEMKFTTDNSLVIIGNSYTSSGDALPAEDQDFYVLKSSLTGELIWERTYGFEEGKTDFGNALVEAGNGDFIWIGSTEKDNLNNQGLNSDMRVVRSNSLGNLIWDYLFGGEGNDYGNKIITLYNEYFLVGAKQDVANNNSDFYLVKIDNNGEEIWSKVYGGDSNENAYDIATTQDGGLIMAGYSFSYGNGKSDIFLVKTDIEGNLQWQSTFGGQGDDEAKSVIQTTDGGFLVAGTVQFENNTMICLIKTNAKGQTTSL